MADFSCSKSTLGKNLIGLVVLNRCETKQYTYG